ncbi:hypothetical protein ACFQJD_08660 [Haloplanus sp. GCM10025708]|uniref:hypothetical protein n=1 Tax=Haloferacaceae TaxID=1644056 RepID=UPI00361193EE
MVVSRAVAALLAVYTYGTVLRNYVLAPADPGLFGFAPQFLLSTVLGILVAVETDPAVADRRQALRVAWYPVWAVAASTPLYVVLAVRGVPVSYWSYHLVLGGVAGVVREALRW